MQIPTISSQGRKVGLAAFCGAVVVALLGLTAIAQAPREEGSRESPTPPAPRADTAEIQLLGVNDFHGHLEPPRRGVGGAAALKAHLDRAAHSHPGRTIRVHAGDMVGASPLLSSHFHDEPAVQAMNVMGFDVGTLGNHEFDEGGDELIRLLRGGRRRDGLERKRDAEQRLVNTSAPDFEGVRFPYIAANTVDREGGLALPPTQVIERDGVRVGFIGVTTPSTPDYVLSQHAGRFRFLDVSETVNRYAAELQREGVEAIVVLAHSGARYDQGSDGPARGEIMDEAAQMSSAVDVVIAGHTHSRLNERVSNRDGRDDKLVVEARSFGVAYDRVRMTVDRRSGHALEKSADTPGTPHEEVTPDARVESLVSRYARRIAPLAGRVVGRATRSLERERHGQTGGSLGSLAAHAQRRLARSDFAFVNEGNARAELDAGPLTYADVFNASAFEHSVLHMTLRGHEVRRLIEQQFHHEPDVLLHVSGLRYERSGDTVGVISLPDGSRLEPQRRYTLAANQLLVERGGFPALGRGRGVRAVGTDFEAFLRYIESRKEVG